MKLFLILISFLIFNSASAKDFGQWESAAPDLKEYYQSLKWPDDPARSCCGEADAYFADIVEKCPIEAQHCVLVAVITDDRDDESRGRRSIAIGTKYYVPINKIRKPPIPNPTDHNIIFIAQDNSVLCWEPISGL